MQKAPIHSDLEATSKRRQCLSSFSPQAPTSSLREGLLNAPAVASALQSGESQSSFSLIGFILSGTIKFLGTIETDRHPCCLDVIIVRKCCSGIGCCQAKQGKANHPENQEFTVFTNTSCSRPLLKMTCSASTNCISEPSMWVDLPPASSTRRAIAAISQG